MKKAIYLVLLNIIDFLATTYFIVNYGGVSIELNPIGRLMYSNVGITAFIKLVIINMLILVIYECYSKYKIAKISYIVLSVIYTLVCILHLAIFITINL